jgi:hypothetical protein
MLTLLMICAVGAFFTTVLLAMGKCPAWVPLILLSVFACLQVIPKG